MTPAEELRRIVEENGGGNFAASVYLREDGLFFLLNLPFLERLARRGRLARFSELLKIQFTEAVENAEEAIRSANGGGGAGADSLSCVQVGN